MILLFFRQAAPIFFNPVCKRALFFTYTSFKAVVTKKNIAQSQPTCLRIDYVLHTEHSIF